MKVTPTPVAAPAALKTSAALTRQREVVGFVFDPAAPERSFVVELWLDGVPIRLERANLLDPDLAAQGSGDGRKRFVFPLDAETFESARVAEVRLANSGDAVGAPLTLAEAPLIAAANAPGEARWAGDLRISGWLPYDPRGPALVRALIDGEEVARSRAAGFVHVGAATPGGVARGFDLTLPTRLADGRLRRVRVLDGEDREIPGSPCPVLAFPNGLERFLEDRAELGSERLRAGLFDRLLPQSWPFAGFADWARTFPPEPAAAAPGRIAVALIGEVGVEISLATLAQAPGAEGVIGVLSPGSDVLSFAPADLKAFLDGDAADVEIVVFAPSGARFHAQALPRLAEALTRFPEADLAYGDLVLGDGAGGEWPLAFGAFDYERLIEQGYASLAFAARATHVRAALTRGAADLYRLFNSAFDAPGPIAIKAAVHTPGFLIALSPPDPVRATATLLAATRAHLEAREVNFIVEPRSSDLLPAVRVRRIPPTARTTILIPSRNRVDLLAPCVESLRRTLGKVAHEILVVDNESSDPATLDYLVEISRAGVKVARASGPFNFARLVNSGAAVSSAEYILLLNNDVEARREGWLEEMLSRIAEPDVGAVGALLSFPGGGVQHGGVVLGPNLAAAHAFDERPDGDPGYGELLRVAHETSAVTAACLLTRRVLLRGLGGFDGTRYPVLFNDVDYCLRLRASGRRVVFTPHAHLTHHAGASRGRDKPFDGRHRHQRDLDNLRMAWGEALAEDPFYSPLLSLDAPYGGLAWPPRPVGPRLARVASAKIAPPGF
jgi:GT2 family glycosyltransferase